MTDSSTCEDSNNMSASFREADDSDCPKHSHDALLESLTVEERLRRLEQNGVDLRPVRQRRLAAKQRAIESVQRKRASQAGEVSAQPAKKRSKHAPTETSSKRSDFIKHKPILTGVGVDIGANMYKARDPRHSALTSSGALDAQQFHRQYEFLVEYRHNEIERLKQKIAARKMTGRKGQQLRKKLGIQQDDNGYLLEEDKSTLKRLQQELADYDRQQINAVVRQRVKSQLRKERGHQYHVKRSELKKLELEAKFDEIKKRGGSRAVNDALSKKRKKNKSRDAARMGVPRDDRA